MIAIYVRKIKESGQHPTNPFTIEDVPAHRVDSVLAALAADGYDGYGRKI